MRISVTCPETVLNFCGGHLKPLALAPITLEYGILTFDIAGETVQQRLESVNALDAHVGGLIADEDDVNIIVALSQLKSSIVEAGVIVQRESLYADSVASSTQEATTTAPISHLSVEQHTSIDESSEQHGAAPNNEETINEQAHTESQPVGYNRYGG